MSGTINLVKTLMTSQIKGPGGRDGDKEAYLILNGFANWPCCKLPSKYLCLYPWSYPCMAREA